MCSETRWTMRIAASKFRLLLFCFAVSSLFALTSCQETQRKPGKYLIPDGYIGWVRIDFNVKDAPALPTDDGFYLLKIPPNGNLRTSTPEEYGTATDEYFYYSASDRKPLKSTGWDGGGMIWARSNGSRSGAEGTYEHFFVGTEEQYKTLGVNYKDENSDWKIGPMPH